jgi:D-beta-D-heptose 7-phosphate kinase / D-beta-D-heptose 1-phosphate adenosyltransferase
MRRRGGEVRIRYMPTRLIEILQNLSRGTVVLLGDLMIDRYLYGNAERLSPEAPVPVLHFQHEEMRLGGCAGVAGDLAVLGSHVRLIGVVGDDEPGQRLRQLLSESGIAPGHLILDASRPTTCKLRLVGSAQHRHPQQLLRLDFEQTVAVSQAIADELIRRTIHAMDGAQVVAIEDYNKGTLPPAVIQKIIAAARERNLPVIVDPAAVTDYSRYAWATAIKLNRSEASRASGINLDKSDQAPAAARRLLSSLGLEAVILTMDKQGAFLATKDGHEQWLSTRPRQVFDVTGAGDMVLAAIAAARAVGATWPDAVALANIAGGLEVERFGAVPVKPAEILHELLSEHRQRIGKQRTLEQLLPELAHQRAIGKRIVFTNGCFDLIHLGHVKYFQFAKRQGDLLVVGVNTDAGIRKLKGDSRPIITQADRLGVLEELSSIDYIVTFDEETPVDLIRAVRPDVLVKGADYAKEKVVGWDFVEGYGGRVALAPLVDGRSTSGLIQRILEAHQNSGPRT